MHSCKITLLISSYTVPNLPPAAPFDNSQTSLILSSTRERNVTVDDTSSAIIYTPLAGDDSSLGWDARAGCTITRYFSNTVHVSARQNSYATFSFNGMPFFNFQGSAIYFMSTYFGDHSNIFVTLDSNAPVRLTNMTGGLPLVSSGVARVIPWKAENLEYGPHTVIVTCDQEGLNSTSTLDIDAFMYVPYL